MITGYNTGDVLNDEIDLYVGDEFGALEIGNIQLFQSNLVLGDLDVNGTFITRHTGGNSNIRFAWAGADNLIRLAIPKEGIHFAIYNPRSEMIGGDLGQAFDNDMVNCTAQGYRYIDCSTDITGADLGVQDDFEFHGSLFGGNGTWNVSDDGNMTVREINIINTNTGSNAGTDLCIDTNGRICACGSCA